jgi:transcriptional regulator with XRE-family HTH domain
MPTFGQRLRDLRKAKGLSQRALGDMAGVTVELPVPIR